MLDQIKQFIFDSVEKPALDDERLEKEFKTQIQRTMVWIRRFRKPGDLLRYMNRFAGSDQHNSLYHRFKDLGLKTFEDLCPDLNGTGIVRNSFSWLAFWLGREVRLGACRV